jgi:ferredoxin
VKVSIDPDRCTCSGACAAIPGGLFVLEEDAGSAEVVGSGEVPAGLEPYAQMAVTLCPTHAISVDEPWRPPTDVGEPGA